MVWCDFTHKRALPNGSPKDLDVEGMRSRISRSEAHAVFAAVVIVYRAFQFVAVFVDHLQMGSMLFLNQIMQRNSLKCMLNTCKKINRFYKCDAILRFENITDYMLTGIHLT